MGNGLAALAGEMEQDRDRLADLASKITAECRGLAAELDALKIAYSRQQTEIESYRRERDQAVERLVGFRTMFGAVLQIMQKHAGEGDETRPVE
jgi:molecular chaperone GrpE (heat shock protein)